MSETRPMGGTELLYSYVQSALPDLVDQVQIILSRPEQVTLENKPRLLWLHDLPQDPAIQALRDPSYRSKFNRILFVSHWQQQQFQQYLGVPYSQGIVMKNGVPYRRTILPKPKPENKLRFIYTSTPHRGLGILAVAADKLAQVRQDWELHVYSSMHIYARGSEDAKFEPIYDLLRKNPCVTYHGTQSNANVREALDHAHVFIYPSVYPETSCMAIQEAMMAGCLAITTNYGALPETCGEWAWTFQFDERPEVMIERTYHNMVNALTHYDNEYVQSTLQVQSVYYQQFYAFETRVEPWKKLLTQVIAEGVPQEKLVFN